MTRHYQGKRRQQRRALEQFGSPHTLVVARAADGRFETIPSDRSDEELLAWIAERKKEGCSVFVEDARMLGIDVQETNTDERMR